MRNPERFKQARELRGLTQEELSKRAQVSQSLVGHVEVGTHDPSDALTRAIAFQTGLPIAFFDQDAPPDFTYGSLLYRSRASMPSRERRMSYRYGQIAFELVEKLGRRLSFPPLRLPRIDESPETAARMMRVALGIPPDAPVQKLINSLERHGVLILASPIRAVSHDAFSLWAGQSRERAVIVIAHGKPGDRLRFSVSHELRHLTSRPTGSKGEIEKDADRFAAEFLMPSEAMKDALVPPVTLTTLAALKPRWGVAIQALVRRAAELETISANQYRYLMQQISARGWRSREPIDVPAERPRALRQMAETLYGNPIDFVRLAADTRLSTAVVREIMDLHLGRKPPEQDQAFARPGKVLSLPRA